MLLYNEFSGSLQLSLNTKIQFTLIFRYLRTIKVTKNETNGLFFYTEFITIVLRSVFIIYLINENCGKTTI